MVKYHFSIDTSTTNIVFYSYINQKVNTLIIIGTSIILFVTVFLYRSTFKSFRRVKIYHIGLPKVKVNYFISIQWYSGESNRGGTKSTIITCTTKSWTIMYMYVQNILLSVNKAPMKYVEWWFEDNLNTIKNIVIVH